MNTPTKKKGLIAVQRGQARTETHSSKNRNGTPIMTLNADTRSKHHRSRRTFWAITAIVTALVVVLTAQPLVTDLAIFTTALVVTRLSVVDRRRARRAAHRASVRARLAQREALEVANATHRALVEAVA